MISAPLHLLPLSDSLQHWLIRHARNQRKTTPQSVSGCLVAQLFQAIDLENNPLIYEMCQNTPELVAYYEAYTGEQAIYE